MYMDVRGIIIHTVLGVYENTGAPKKEPSKIGSPEKMDPNKAPQLQKPPSRDGQPRNPSLHCCRFILPAGGAF